MRIGITTFGCDAGKSGIGQYIRLLLKEFADFQDQCSFELIGIKSEKNIFLKDNDYLVYYSIPDFWGNPLINIFWHQAALNRLCRKRKYDVLFIPAGNRRLPFKIDIPFVGTVHDLSMLHVKNKYDPLRTLYIKKCLPFFMRRLSKVITISISSQKDIVGHAGVEKNKVSVIPLAADGKTYSRIDKNCSISHVEKKFGISKPFILYISRIEHPGKNHFRLIKAFELFKKRNSCELNLVLAGGDWNRAEEVHAAADNSAFPDEIIFTGFAPDEDLPYLYNASEMFIFPSLYEGFGIPVLEAMLCGVPVLCSNISSIPEVAGDAAVLFDPYNIENIADSIEKVFSSGELQQKLSDAGINRSKGFSWKITAEKTLNIIKSVNNNLLHR